MRSKVVKPADTADSQYRPYRRLAAAVITSAIEDYFVGKPDDKQDARRFLFGTGRTCASTARVKRMDCEPEVDYMEILEDGETVRVALGELYRREPAFPRTEDSRNHWFGQAGMHTPSEEELLERMYRWWREIGARRAWAKKAAEKKQQRNAAESEPGNDQT